MAKLTVELEPWTIPNFVRPKRPVGKRQDGINFTDVDCVRLEDCSYETLNSMCNEFRKAVFDKAGIKDTQTYYG